MSLKLEAFCNYYRKFIKGYAQIAKPLYQLIAGDNAKRKTNEIEWTDQCKEAFLKLKEICSDTPILAHADYTKTLKYIQMLQSRGWGQYFTKTKMMAPPVL